MWKFLSSFVFGITVTVLDHLKRKSFPLILLIFWSQNFVFVIWSFHYSLRHRDIQQSNAQHNDFIHPCIQHDDILYDDIQYYSILQYDISQNYYFKWHSALWYPIEWPAILWYLAEWRAFSLTFNLMAFSRMTFIRHDI